MPNSQGGRSLSPRQMPSTQKGNSRQNVDYSHGHKEHSQLDRSLHKGTSRSTSRSKSAGRSSGKHTGYRRRRTVRFVGSPSSANPEDPLEKPDISVLCDLCAVHIDLRALADHRRYHDALDVMKYKGSARPETTIKLMQRRRAILRKMNSMLKPEDPPIDSDVIHRVNDAYEFIKSDMEETYEAFRKVKDTVNTGVEGVAVNSGVDCILAVGICSAANSRWKSAMEDTNVFQDCLGGDPDKAFVGLYDGHHGPFAAERVQEEFHHALLYEMAKFDPKVKWNESIANKSHSTCDYADFAWPADYDEEEEDHGIEDGGVCTMHQVIRGFEERLERIKRQKEKEKEASSETEIENREIRKEVTETDSIEQTGRKSARKKKYGNAYSEKVEYAMNQAYKYSDLLLSWGKEEQSNVRWSGCSAFTGVIENTGEKQLDQPETEEPSSKGLQENEQADEGPTELGRLHLAHAGNVNCVLIRGNQPYRLTRDHTPKNLRERARVEKMGGSVSESNRDVRVNGIISATRGLGNHGDTLLKQCIPGTPYTTVVPLDEHAQFLIIASQGVWEVFSEDEAAHVLLEMLPCNQLPPPSRLATSIQYLLAAKSRSHSVDTSHVPASELMERLRSFSGMTAASVPLPEHLQHMGPSPDVTRRRHHVINDVNDLGDLPENDLQTEIGSQGGYSDDESGNEADVDTCLDQYTIPPVSRMSIAPPGRDEIQREFAKVLAERLVQAAMLAGSKDNVTAMVILLPGCGL